MIRHGKYEDVPQLKALWKQAFGDEDNYIDDFFQRVFCPEYVLCEEEDGTITAMLYKLPCTVQTDKGAEDKAFYLYALATEQCCRGKGIMGRLITAAKREIHACGCSLLFLIPAQESLTDYYGRFQFEPINRASAYYMENIPGAKREMLAASADGKPEEAIIALEKVCVSEAKEENPAALMGRRWAYTNCNVRFPDHVERFCLDWMLAEKESCFYKIISSGEVTGFLQGEIKNQIFKVNCYGMDRKCWNELASTVSREGISEVQVLSCENPDIDSFTQSVSGAGPRISVCAGQELKGIHGVIPL